MPIYMDRHDLSGATAVDVANAHLVDLTVQERYGVRYLTYWFDYDRQRAFCLASGPDRDAVEAVHRESHGLMAHEVIEVDRRDVERFLGPVIDHPPGEPYVETAFRTILFTDIEDSTRLTQRFGDARAMELVRVHDGIVRDAIEGRGGSEIKHTGDGVMAAFASVSSAIESAIAIQRRIAEKTEPAALPLRVRIGLAAGEPVLHSRDLFGAAVQLAARLCARAGPGEVLVSSAVHDLAIGKAYNFAKRGRARLKGFEEPMLVYEVVWQAS
ncbi:MAG: DUF4242 domain-containing protein [Sporichthyaceae bacterium]|nr:DUF4242 domain-containing protein [Sporichthyaceae bacterium]